MVQDGIPRVCFYFCHSEQNSEHFSLPRNGSEWNSESLLLFCSTVSNIFLFQGNGSERNSESFLFCGTAKIPPEQNICSVYFVFRGIIFCRKLLFIWRPCSWHVALRLYRQNKSLSSQAQSINKMYFGPAVTAATRTCKEEKKTTPTGVVTFWNKTWTWKMGNRKNRSHEIQKYPSSVKTWFFWDKDNWRGVQNWYF